MKKIICILISLSIMSTLIYATDFDFTDLTNYGIPIIPAVKSDSGHEIDGIIDQGEYGGIISDSPLLEIGKGLEYTDDDFHEYRTDDCILSRHEAAKVTEKISVSYDSEFIYAGISVLGGNGIVNIKTVYISIGLNNTSDPYASLAGLKLHMTFNSESIHPQAVSGMLTRKTPSGEMIDIKYDSRNPNQKYGKFIDSKGSAWDVVRFMNECIACKKNDAGIYFEIKIPIEELCSVGDTAAADKLNDGENTVFGNIFSGFSVSSDLADFLISGKPIDFPLSENSSFRNVFLEKYPNAHSPVPVQYISIPIWFMGSFSRYNASKNSIPKIASNGNTDGGNIVAENNDEVPDDDKYSASLDDTHNDDPDPESNDYEKYQNDEKDVIITVTFSNEKSNVVKRKFGITDVISVVIALSTVASAIFLSRIDNNPEKKGDEKDKKIKDSIDTRKRK